MVDMTDLKSVEHKSLVWVRLPPLVRVTIWKQMAEQTLSMKWKLLKLI